MKALSFSLLISAFFAQTLMAEVLNPPTLPAVLAELPQAIRFLPDFHFSKANSESLEKFSREFSNYKTNVEYNNLESSRGLVAYFRSGRLEIDQSVFSVAAERSNYQRRAIALAAALMFLGIENKNIQIYGDGSMGLSREGLLSLAKEFRHGDAIHATQESCDVRLPGTGAEEKRDSHFLTADYIWRVDTKSYYIQYLFDAETFALNLSPLTMIASSLQRLSNPTENVLHHERREILVDENGGRLEKGNQSTFLKNLTDGSQEIWTWENGMKGRLIASSKPMPLVYEANSIVRTYSTTAGGVTAEFSCAQGPAALEWKEKIVHQIILKQVRDFDKHVEAVLELDEKIELCTESANCASLKKARAELVQKTDALWKKISGEIDTIFRKEYKAKPAHKRYRGRAYDTFTYDRYNGAKRRALENLRSSQCVHWSYRTHSCAPLILDRESYRYYYGR